MENESPELGSNTNPDSLTAIFFFSFMFFLRLITDTKISNVIQLNVTKFYV